MSTPDVTVAQCSKPLHPTVWLEISYTGTAPPTALFEDLEMIGWRPPVPAAPPASAIDWDTPDEVTGERFTIRPWRVEGAVVEPPRGSGSRGHWTAADRDAFLLALGGVLRRHGLADDERPPPPTAAPAPGTTPAATAGDEGSSTTPGPVPDPAHVAPTAAPAPGTAVVRAELPSTVDREAVAGALAPLGLAAHIASETKAITTTYRGTPFTTEVAVVQAEVLVGADRATVVAALLRDLGLAPTVDDGGPLPDDHRTPVAPDPVEGVAPDPAGTRPVALTVEVSRADEVRAALAEVAVGPVAVAEGTLTITSTYRGSTFDQERPARIVRGHLRAGPAERVLAELCARLGLPGDDGRRVQLGSVVPLTPSPEQAPAHTG